MITGDYWKKAKDPISRWELFIAIKRVFKETGYDDDGVCFVVRYIKRRGNKGISKGWGFFNDKLVILILPDNPYRPDMYSTIDHELDHTCGKLNHKDMVRCSKLTKKWEKILDEGTGTR